MPTTPKVYISVLNWNGAEKTIQCLQSLEQLDYPNYQVVVVDNASTDRSVEQIRQAYPDMPLICAEANLGYAGGNELALQQALADPDAELFWILNNDAVVQHDTLSALVETYTLHGQALYGGVPLSINSQQTDDWRIQVTLWELHAGGYRLNRLNGVSFHQYFKSQEARPAGSLSGSCLCIPLALIRQHGYMNTDFFLYWEDTDYCFRLRQANIQSYIVPKAVIFHTRGGSRQQNPALKSMVLYYQTRNRLFFYRKYFGFAGYMGIMLRQVAYVVYWLLVWLTGQRAAFHHARHTLWGIRDALTGRSGKTLAPEAYLEREQL